METISFMDEEIQEQQHHHRHRHKVRRVRRRTGLGRENYFLLGLALVGCMAAVCLLLWLLNRAHFKF